MPGGVAPKFGSEKVSRYTGVPQLQLQVSRYTVQLKAPLNSFMQMLHIEIALTEANEFGMVPLSGWLSM